MPATQITYDEAEQQWGDVVQRLGYFVRRFVAERMKREQPDLEEIGSSDINCRAISWIRSGLLVLSPIPHWTDEL